MARTLEALANALKGRFRPDRAHGVDMRLKLDVGGRCMLVSIRDDCVTIESNAINGADVTFLFQDLDTAWQIMLGEASAIDAFMHGRFRADGYLMMAFRLMEMFGSVSLPPTPND